jgi:hypothetical protein
MASAYAAIGRRSRAREHEAKIRMMEKIEHVIVGDRTPYIEASLSVFDRGEFFGGQAIVNIDLVPCPNLRARIKHRIDVLNFGSDEVINIGLWCGFCETGLKVEVRGGGLACVSQKDCGVSLLAGFNAIHPRIWLGEHIRSDLSFGSLPRVNYERLSGNRQSTSEYRSGEGSEKCHCENNYSRLFPAAGVILLGLCFDLWGIRHCLHQFDAGTSVAG